MRNLFLFSFILCLFSQTSYAESKTEQIIRKTNKLSTSKRQSKAKVTVKKETLSDIKKRRLKELAEEYDHKMSTNGFSSTNDKYTPPTELKPAE